MLGGTGCDKAQSAKEEPAEIFIFMGFFAKAVLIHILPGIDAAQDGAADAILAAGHEGAAIGRQDYR